LTPKGNPEAVSNIVSLVNLGAGVGAFLSFFLNDRIGRIWSYRTYMTIYIIGNLIETFSYGNLGALYFGRLFGGLGVGACTVVGPMAIVEIAPETTRGLMAIWFNISMVGSQFIGVFLVYGVNRNISPTSNLQWQIPFFAQTFIPAIGILMSFYLSESPRWLALRGRVDESRKVLMSLRGATSEHPLFQQEFDRMISSSVLQTAEFGGRNDWDTIRETFSKRSNLRRVQLTLVAYLLAQMSGANAITNYLPEIFGLIGLTGSDTKIFATGFYSLAKVVFALMASLFLVDVVGRRKSLFAGATIQMLCVAARSSNAFFDQNSLNFD
jgi:MFS family permease